MQSTDTKPNGPVAAAFIAAGAACFTLGLMVVGVDANDSFKSALDFSKNYGLGSGVGPLSGKIAIATIVYVVTWLGLHLALRRQEVAWRRVMIATGILVGLGFLLTFPPAFELIADTIKGG
jgi:hypothetical protein